MVGRVQTVLGWFLVAWQMSAVMMLASEFTSGINCVSRGFLPWSRAFCTVAKERPFWTFGKLPEASRTDPVSASSKSPDIATWLTVCR